MSAPTNVFFAAQGSTYEIERDGGFLWAPQKNRGGDPMFYWENLTHVEAGNIILHYARGNFRAISEVHAQLTDNGWQGWSEENMPKELPDSQDIAGWIVKCEYTEFIKPLPIEDFTEIILKFKSDKHSGFDKNGNVNSGYLYHLEDEIADAVIRKALGNQPDLSKLDYLVEYLNR